LPAGAGRAIEEAVDAQIRTDGLGKTYRVGFWGRRVRAVEDLSLEVRQGEIFALLGPNGAGKTTTIKMLLGFVRPSAGSAFIGGEPAGTVASRRKLGYLPENPALYEFLRGDEYLVFAGRLAGLSSAEARRQSVKLLERVGLAGRADRAIRKFSKGMVQRLGLAQALIGDPATVILDEPMSGLDPIGRKDVRDIILGLRDEGRTVLFSTHILSDVEAICDRVGIMVEGRMTDVGALHDLVAPGARAVELIVEGLTPELAERFRRDGAAVLERDRQFVVTFKAESDARQALTVALTAGAAVVSFTPHRRSLEELFVERARGKAATS
jgi:ABC-2 type transport system ATP-binding protein